MGAHRELDPRTGTRVTPVVPGVEFHEKIGDGGIAEVWSGKWSPGRGEVVTVAIKVLRDPGRPNLRRRFLREGRILQRQNHPGLVRCLAILDGAQPALILQLLDGASLDRRLASGPLTVPQVYSLAMRMLKILIHLHDQGVVHRDLKASNIWLTRMEPEGPSLQPGTSVDIVLMDLGLAIDPADPLTSTLGEVLGTHAYMAPEQIAGARVDVRADLYSLGITLYEALCGQRPYQARGLAGYLQAHRSGRAAPIADRVAEVHPEFAQFVDRLLARDPADRPQSAAIALAQLILAGPLVRAEPVVVRTLASPRVTIGREAVRGAVLAVLHGGPDGTGGVVQLHGELGCGLAAAAEQARDLAEAEGVEHVTLRTRSGAGPEWAIKELARCLDGWAGRVPPTPSGVRTALAGLAGESRAARRVLLVIEDVADEGLYAWMTELRGALPELSIVTTGPAPRRGLRGTRVALRALTEEETGELIRALLGTPSEPLGIASTVHTATGGQPALIVVAIRRMAAAGALSCVGATDDGSPAWQWNPAIRPPAGIRATRDLRRLLAQLPAPAQRLLAAIAEHPDPVGLEEVEAEAGVEADAVYALVRVGLVSLDNDDMVSLRRPVLAEVIRGGRVASPARTPDTEALARVWEELPQSGWAATRALVERVRETEPPGASEILTLVDAGSLLVWGRTVPQRLVEAVRDLGDGYLMERAWVLATIGLRVGDASAARRRLQRALADDPDFRTRTGADSALALVDLELRLHRRNDAGVRARGLLAQPSFPREHRGRLHLRLAQQHASHLSLHAATESLREARDLLGSSSEPLADLTWTDILLRSGSLDEAERRLTALGQAASDETPWEIRASHAMLLARLRRARRDPAAAHAAHVRAEEDCARAGDEPLRAYHAGMAAALTGDLRAATGHAALLQAPICGDLRAELLSVCARKARDARLYQLAEASARACGDRSLLLGLLHSLRGPGARSEAADLTSAALKDIYSPLRAPFLELAEVQWARSLSG